MCGSHETIYESLFIQARNVLKRELCAYLRSRRLFRRAKSSTTKGQCRARIIDGVSIRQRPRQTLDWKTPAERLGQGVALTD